MHEFAVYHDALETWSDDVVQGSVRSVHDSSLVHRLRKVIRLHVGERCLLFGKEHWARLVIEKYDERSVTMRVIEYARITPLQPRIELYLPLLERGAYEAALSTATVLGVTKIIPLVTAKTKRSSYAHSELERLHRIMIAAAEQSKQFFLPQLDAIQSYEEALRILDNLIAFDINGIPVSQDIVRLKEASVMRVIIGPEGDFTEQERALLDARCVMRYRLTPSILRSEDAVMVGIGLLRCLTYCG